MADQRAGHSNPTPETGFRAALAFYPACGLRGRFDETPFRPYAPVLILQGTADEEVSYRKCIDLVEDSRAAGGEVEIKLFDGATHSFDSPTRNRQKLEANRVATNAAFDIAADFFARIIKGEARSGP